MSWRFSVKYIQPTTTNSIASVQVITFHKDRPLALFHTSCVSPPPVSWHGPGKDWVMECEMNLCLLDFCSFSSFLSSPAPTAVSGKSLRVFSGIKALWLEFPKIFTAWPNWNYSSILHFLIFFNIIWHFMLVSLRVRDSRCFMESFRTSKKLLMMLNFAWCQDRVPRRSKGVLVALVLLPLVT